MGKKVKIRVLYPTAFDKQPEAGSSVEVDEEEAQALIESGAAELMKAEPKAEPESAASEAPEAAVRPRAQARKAR